MTSATNKLGTFLTPDLFRDIAVAFVFAFTATATGSLILTAEALRSVLLIILSFLNLLIRHWNDENKSNRFDYGYHQFQYLIWVGIGLGLIGISVWIGHYSGTGSLEERSWLSLNMVAIAAMANAFCVFINFYSWFFLKVPALRHQSAFASRHLRIRKNIFLSSLAMQVFLTFAVIFQDLKIAFICDLLGFALLGLVSLLQGMNMTRRGLPVVLNIRADRKTRDIVQAAVHEKLPPGMVSSIRTRGGEDWIDARVVCNVSSPSSFGYYADLVEAVQSDLRAQGLNVSLQTWVCRGRSSS